MKVNSFLLPMKAHYFFVFAATAPMLPFLPLVGRQLGIQSGITLIYTVLPFVGVLAKVFAGGLADSRNKHKAILLSAISMAALGLFTLYFTPSIPKSSIVTVSSNFTLDCNPVKTYLRHHHGKPVCGGRNYLATITKPTNVTCIVECPANDSLQDLCNAWGVPVDLCTPSLAFTSIADLYKADMEGHDSFLPIDFAIFNRTEDTLTAIAASDSLHSDGSVATPSNFYSLDYPRCQRKMVLVNCTGFCQNSQLMEYLDAPEKPPTLIEVLNYPQFWMFFCLMLVAWPSFASVVTLSDTICFMLLGRHGGEYGTQRVWGAVGWGLLVIVAGALIDAVSGEEIGQGKDYTPAFLLTLALFMVDLVVVSRIKLQQEPTSTRSKPVTLVSPCLGSAPTVLQLLSQPRVALFIVSCLVVGTSTGALWTYQLMLVEEVSAKWQCDFRWIKLLDGLMLGVQCFLGELPFFLLAGLLLSKLGHVLCMVTVILTFGLRFVLYSIIQNPWLFLPVELLQGLTFGLFYSTMTTYASAVALPGTEATMQALVGAAFEGFGVAIGGSVGGVLFFQYGGQCLFLALGIFNLGFAILFLLLNWVISSCDSSKATYQQHYHVSSNEPVSELSNSELAPVLS